MIAVHGLNGHRERTWSTPSGINWLRDILPADIPNTRILTYGYDSRTHGSDQVITQSTYEHALTFVQVLSAHRRATNVPIKIHLALKIDSMLT